MIDNVEALQVHYKQLENEFTALFERKNYLEGHKIPELTKRYYAVLGVFEYRNNELTLAIMQMQHLLQLAQKYVNRDGIIDFEEIEEITKKKFSEYQRNLKSQLDEIKLAQMKVRQETKVLSDDDAKELKAIYRFLIKSLHPDLTKDDSSERKEFFEQVMAAYKNGDLQLMMALKAMFEIQFPDDEEQATETKDEQDYRNEIARFEELIKQQKFEIKMMESAFPYTMKELLMDDELLTKKRAELEDKQVVLEATLAKMEKEYQDLKLWQAESQDTSWSEF
ncbi:gas vesicle protein [Enterococcus sp. PF1-24]|uniref:J domain-containing protein n=1 Tax=unclassified Enterococcus TaxID=2608891 RepID=UPI002476B160|nr:MULTISPECIES: J domain-containing protein [unclassified Enterococcus]MDH6364591.1 gas vesicle protein [Enterococcus sp. PFB1-1]MDH6401692.1 gas vesicle protein [Enterococcus sp. PF1-24]